MAFLMLSFGAESFNIAGKGLLMPIFAAVVERQSKPLSRMLLGERAEETMMEGGSQKMGGERRGGRREGAKARVAPSSTVVVRRTYEEFILDTLQKCMVSWIPVTRLSPGLWTSISINTFARKC